MNILREYATSKLRKLTEQAMEMVKFNNASVYHESSGVNVTSTLAQGKNQNVLITLNPIELPVQGEAIFVF